MSAKTTVITIEQWDGGSLAGKWAWGVPSLDGTDVLMIHDPFETAQEAYADLEALVSLGAPQKIRAVLEADLPASAEHSLAHLDEIVAVLSGEVKVVIAAPCYPPYPPS